METASTWIKIGKDVMTTFWAMLSSNICNIFHHAEVIYNKNPSMASLVNQVQFFMLCDRWFCPEDRLTSLYSLLFYNVIGYLFVYASRLLSLHNYTPIVKVSEHSNIRHLAMTATKVVLDLAKVVTFIITGVFMLLVFGLEQGLEHFNPTWTYILVTTFYFILTEPKCQNRIPNILLWVQIDYLESLEFLWARVISTLLASLLSVIMITIVWFLTEGGWVLIFSCSYLNVYLVLRIMGEYWKELLKEKQSLEKYRYASKQEINDNDDVCAVCLQIMRSARITPCKHMFHGSCLKRCIKQELNCPMCKQTL